MLTMKSLFMKLFVSFFLIIAFVFPSCAQQQKKVDSTASKEQTKPTAVQKAKMKVDGMVCSACQSNVKKTIKSLTGVTGVQVSLENKIARFSYDPLKVKPEQIQKVVNEKGYTAGKPQAIKQ